MQVWIYILYICGMSLIVVRQSLKLMETDSEHEHLILGLQLETFIILFYIEKAVHPY